MRKILTISIITIALFAVACNNTTETPKAEISATPETSLVLESANKFFAVLPTEAPNANNELTPEKIALGKALYHDKKLSKDGTQSCNTCHDVLNYGVDNLPTSPGDNGGLGTRNSPSTFNAALHISQFWDGRNADVEEQAGGPILNPVEMAIPDEKFILDRLKVVEEYKIMFAAAYPADENPFTYKNLTYAIGAFERTLLTPAPFDKYLAGDEAAISDIAKQGITDFIDAGCTTCHSGALLGGQMHMKFGLFANYWEHTNSAVIDSGKYQETKVPADMFMFKVPSLRNIAKTGPYFHDGVTASLEDAIQIMAITQNNKELTLEQVKNISAFMETLTGEMPENANIEI